MIQNWAKDISIDLGNYQETTSDSKIRTRVYLKKKQKQVIPISHDLFCNSFQSKNNGLPSFATSGDNFYLFKRIFNSGIFTIFSRFEDRWTSNLNEAIFMDDKYFIIRLILSIIIIDYYNINFIGLSV